MNQNIFHRFLVFPLERFTYNFAIPEPETITMYRYPFSYCCRKLSNYNTNAVKYVRRKFDLV